MALVTPDFSPIFQNDTGKALATAWTHKDGTPEPLAGATFTMKMQSLDGTITKVCSGPWVIDDPVNGLAHYQWQTADVNQVGEWKLYIARIIAGAPLHGDDGNGHPLVLEILPAP